MAAGFAAFVHCTAAVINAADGRRTMGVTTVVRAAGDRRTMRIKAESIYRYRVR
ncbi:MAG: hypothetical protein HXL35_00700 [Prevotellaceae bacterium]|nr:hypothetical protein [Prevotellaceae bacterium]MBF1061234.1 hypothetical protein [Prevotellaceae bacterium]